MGTFALKSADARRSSPARIPARGGELFGQRHEGTPAAAHLRQKFSRIRIYPAAKLKVNAPGDAFEQEAEWVADEVTRTPEQGAPADVRQAAGSGGFIQRLEADRDPSLADAVVVEEDETQKATVQTLRPAGRQGGMETVSQRELNSSQGGFPLGSPVRGFMEARFGADFGRVQVHADHRAAALCDSLDARAFTYGSHIYFGAREYQPDSREGRRVLAHELTHVVQQGGSPSQVPVSHSPAGVQRLRAPGRALRENVAPWGRGGPTGTDYEVETDAGSVVTGWKAYSPWRVPLQYWCHGHSTNSYVDFGYSVYSGRDFTQVVHDEWTNVAPAQTQAGDIAVWTAGYDHSARFTQPVIENGQLSPDRSVLSTKNGQSPLTNMTLTAIAGVYGGAGIGVFRHI